MKTNKKLLLAAGIALLALALVLCYARFGPGVRAGEKRIALTVVHGDGSEKAFALATREEYLGPALMDEGLIEGEAGPYGLFLTAVDGERADEARQEWWCLTKDGAQHDYGVDATALSDGDRYELTLRTGW